MRWPPVKTVNQICSNIFPDWGGGVGVWSNFVPLMIPFNTQIIVNDKVIRALTTSRNLLLQLRLPLFNLFYLSDFDCNSDSDSDSNSNSDFVYYSDSSYHSKLRGQPDPYSDFNSVSDSDLGQILKLKQVNWSLQQEKWKKYINIYRYFGLKHSVSDSDVDFDPDRDFDQLPSQLWLRH